MLSRITLVICLGVLWSCGGTSSSPASDPGPLVDNTQWVPTADGGEIFGRPPEGSECELMPIGDCPEFPWPENECVTFEEGSNCIASYVPECFPPPYTVLAVYTRMPDDRIPLCDWLTLEQPSLRTIRAGDQVEVRTFHAELTAPAPGGEARMSFVVGERADLQRARPHPVWLRVSKLDVDGHSGLSGRNPAPLARRQSRQQRIPPHRGKHPRPP